VFSGLLVSDYKSSRELAGFMSGLIKPVSGMDYQEPWVAVIKSDV